MISDFFSGDEYEKLLAPLYETENVNEEETTETKFGKKSKWWCRKNFPWMKSKNCFLVSGKLRKLLGFTENTKRLYGNYPEA